MTAEPTRPHAWYGPCDALGPHGECVECMKRRDALIEALRALDAVLDFNEDYGANEATVIEDPTAINAAFALARSALSGAAKG